MWMMSTGHLTRSVDFRSNPTQSTIFWQPHHEKKKPPRPWRGLWVREWLGHKQENDDGQKKNLEHLD